MDSFAHTRTVSGAVLLHEAQPVARRPAGKSLPAEQSGGRAVLEPGAGSDFSRDGVRAGSGRLDRADDPQRGRAAGARVQTARHRDAIYGAVHLADAGERRHQPLRRFESAARGVSDFNAGRFDSGDDGNRDGGAISGTENCDDDVDRRRRNFDGRVSRGNESGGGAEGSVCVGD